MKIVVFILFTFILTFQLKAHNKQHQEQKVTYLGNEALLVEYGTAKALFDPFFHSHFNTYSLVPDDIRKKIFAKEEPYTDISAIFISHAHGDHFSDTDTLRYLLENPKTDLIAPQQAVDMLKKLNGFAKLKNTIIPIDLAFKEDAKTFTTKDLKVEAVRIPHAGWPGRADVQNMVYRVTANDATIMHMGDADVDKTHYQIHKKLWNKKTTNAAFPPYWFFYSQEGISILEDTLHVERSIGIHVPTVTPKGLNETGKDYFSIPGEARVIKKNSVEDVQ